jgi:DNA-directed RNA polymerase subunit RPC12/RpoP
LGKRSVGTHSKRRRNNSVLLGQHSRGRLRPELSASSIRKITWLPRTQTIALSRKPWVSGFATLSWLQSRCSWSGGCFGFTFSDAVGPPVLPHELFGVGCCGCLYVIAGAENEYRCNECGATIPPDEVHRVALEMESTEVACRHCGKRNEIHGFCEVHAFVCRYCGRGVDLKSD